MYNMYFEVIFKEHLTSDLIWFDNMSIIFGDMHA